MKHHQQTDEFGVKLLLALILYWILPAGAEYRAYRLKITNSNTGSERLLTSTLDHIQYGDYHPLNPFETLSYVESWMCWGNTRDFQAICPNPNRERAPANAEPKPKSERP